MFPETLQNGMVGISGISADLFPSSLVALAHVQEAFVPDVIIYPSYIRTHHLGSL
jgi:hypothetical protein